MSTTSKGIKVVSLFDGIGCGYEALERAGIKVAEYHAYEIDNVAAGIAKIRHPDIIQHGDVRQLQFADYDGFDLCLFGFPCQDLSRLNHNGLGLEGSKSCLFTYGAELATHCKYFLCENVQMSPANRNKVSNALGVPAMLIDSAEYCPQTRARNYWTNLPIVERHAPFMIWWADGVRHWMGNKCAQDILDDGIAPRPLYGCVTAHEHFAKNGGAERIKSGWIQNFKCYEDPNGDYVHGETPYSVARYETEQDAIDAAVARYNMLELGKRYRIVRLNINEYERLQTLPDNYTAYTIRQGKMVPTGYFSRLKAIGNGWTVDVIADLLSCLK